MVEAPMQPLTPLLEFFHTAAQQSLQEYQRSRTMNALYNLGHDLVMLKKKVSCGHWKETCRVIGISHETARILMTIYETFKENPAFRSSVKIPLTVLYQLARLPKSAANEILTRNTLNGKALTTLRERDVKAYRLSHGVPIRVTVTPSPPRKPAPVQAHPRTVPLAPDRGREIIQDMYTRITRLRQAGVSRLLRFLDRVRGDHATH